MSAAIHKYSVIVIGIAVAACACAVPALADHQPSIVMPNYRGIPPIVDGVDATGAVIEGDWGLRRPGAGTRTFYGGGALLEPADGGYFPFTGRRPRYGRHEVEPRASRRKPVPAQSYYRSWTTDGRGSASADVPYNPPSVIEGQPAERSDPNADRRGDPSDQRKRRSERHAERHKHDSDRHKHGADRHKHDSERHRHHTERFKHHSDRPMRRTHHGSRHRRR